MCDASKDKEAAVRTILGRVDGIVIGNDTISDAMVRQIVRSTPTVLVARDAIEGCDAVQVENFISSAELTRHLLEHGRSRLVFVGDPDSSHDISERYRGFQHALTRKRGAEVAGPIRVQYEETSGRTRPGGAPGGRGGRGAGRRARLRQRRARARDDGASRSRGPRVPDDVAVVGFDDIMTSRYLAPGLTTVQQPMRELGRWAAIRLHERIGGRTFDVHPQVLPTRMVVRGSCGCDWDQTSVVSD